MSRYREPRGEGWDYPWGDDDDDDAEAEDEIEEEDEEPSVAREGERRPETEQAHDFQTNPPRGDAA